MARQAPGHVAGDVVVAGGTVAVGGGVVVGAIGGAVGAMVVVGVVVVVVAAVVVVVAAVVVVGAVVVVIGDRVVVVLRRVVVVVAGDDGGGVSATGRVVGGAAVTGIVPLIQPSRSVVDVDGIGGRVEATGVTGVTEVVGNRSAGTVVGVSAPVPASRSAGGWDVGERSVRSRSRTRTAGVSDRIGRSARLSGAADGARVVVTARARVDTVVLAVAAAAARGEATTVPAPPLKKTSPLSGADCAAICIPRTNGAATETPVDALTPPETVCTMLATGPLPEAR